MQKYELLLLAVLSVMGKRITAQTVSYPLQAKSSPIRVELRKVDSTYHLYRNGKLYFVKGAGGSMYPDRVAAYGGNSIRTWSSNTGQQVLDSAQKYGLTVLMGLDVARERHGFNYD